MFSRSSAALTLALLVSISPYAASETVTLPIDGQLRTTYSGPRTVQIPKFDPALGELQSVTIEFSPEFSGTVAGTASGPPNTPNGWAIEYSGTLRLSGPGFSLDFPYFYSRSGLVFQPGAPVFEVFGPAAPTGSTGAFATHLPTYTGDGAVACSLSWPGFTCDLFWSRSGSSETCTRDLGAVGGTVTYEFAPPPCPGDLNGDRVVDLVDVSLLLADFGCSTPPCVGDLDSDGVTGITDLAMILSNFGAVCP